MFDNELLELSQQLKHKILESKNSKDNNASLNNHFLSHKPISIATAESCSGGMLSAAITATPGSSMYYKQGFITYSNESKIQLLNVRPDILEIYGAVSIETAKAMAKGCLLASQSNIAVSITGIAGPDGGGVDKPIGLVWISLATLQDTPRASKSIKHHHINTSAKQYHFSGDRHSIRMQSCIKALEMILTHVTNSIT